MVLQGSDCDGGNWWIVQEDGKKGASIEHRYSVPHLFLMCYLNCSDVTCTCILHVHVCYMYVYVLMLIM